MLDLNSIYFSILGYDPSNLLEYHVKFNYVTHLIKVFFSYFWIN